MDITDVRIRKFEAKGNMKAIASITLSNEIVIHDIKIFENQAGDLYIAMPSRKTPDGEYKDIAHPISSVARQQLQSTIIDKYRAELMKEAAEAAMAPPPAPVPAPTTETAPAPETELATEPAPDLVAEPTATPATESMAEPAAEPETTAAAEPEEAPKETPKETPEK